MQSQYWEFLYTSFIFIATNLIFSRFLQRGLLPASLLQPADVKTSKGKKDTVIYFSLNNTTHSIHVHAAHLRDLMEALYRLIKMTFLLSSSLLHPPRWDNTTVVSGDIKWIKGNFDKKTQASALWQICFHCGKKTLHYLFSCSASFHREFPVGFPSHQDSSHPLAHSLSIVLQLLLRVKITHTLVYLKPFFISFAPSKQLSAVRDHPNITAMFSLFGLVASCLPDFLNIKYKNTKSLWWNL